MDDPNPAECDVVLVHGTFAQNASWTKAGSAFSKAILECPEASVRLHRFSWSGRNTHSARLVAASQLRVLFDNIRTERPHGRLYVVAHSHGGNVLLYALRNGLAPDRIVFLATPFVIPARRELALWAHAAASGKFVLLVSTALVGLASTYHFLPSMSQAIALLLLFGVPALVILFFIWSAPDSPFIGVRMALEGKVASIWSLDAAFFQDMILAQQLLFERLQVTLPPDVSALIVCPKGDEARHALRVIDWIGELPIRVLNLSSIVVTSGFAAFAFVPRSVRPLTGTFLSLLGVEAASIIAIILFGLIIAAPAFTLLIALISVVWINIKKLGHWDAGIVETLSCRLFARKIPAGYLVEPALGPKKSFLLEYSSWGGRVLQAISLRLGHSQVYRDNQLLKQIADWVHSGKQIDVAKSIGPRFLALRLPMTSNWANEE